MADEGETTVGVLLTLLPLRAAGAIYGFASRLMAHPMRWYWHASA